MVNLTLESVNDSTERESLLALQSDLQQLIQLTRENLEALVPKDSQPAEAQATEPKDELDDEYALFMVNTEMISIIIKYVVMERPL